MVPTRTLPQAPTCGASKTFLAASALYLRKSPSGLWHTLLLTHFDSGRDATGATMWSAGPGQGATVQVKGGQSYYCIYGDVPAPAGAQASTVDARRLHVSLDSIHSRA
jgi:hypothetical protein